MKYRHLGRNSAHRQALLRNLVTSLFKHESISTTWPKAKEAQRLAEKLITLGKRNTDAARRKAMAVFFVRLVPSKPLIHLIKLRMVHGDVMLRGWLHRNLTPSSLSSSVPFAAVTQNAPEDTPASCALSPSKTTKLHPRSLSWSTDPETCASP